MGLETVLGGCGMEVDAAGKLRSIYPKIFVEIWRCISCLSRQLIFNKHAHWASFMEEIPVSHGRDSDQTLRHANPTQSKGAVFFVRNLELTLQKDPSEFDKAARICSLSEPSCLLMKYRLQFRAFF
jgi:hypothetical protein